jgi:transcriptional regulator with XRE-family HTH domain
MSKVDVQIVAALGKALYGQCWQRAVARDLGVHDCTIGRWLRGVGDPTLEDLLRMLAVTKHRIDRLLATYDAAVEGARLKPRQPAPVQPPARPESVWNLKQKRDALPGQALKLLRRQ